MKKTFSIFIAAMLIVTATNAQTTKWANDASHSSIKFTVSHLTVSEVEGRFKSFKGNMESATPDFTDAKINFTADVNSITTD